MATKKIIRPRLDEDEIQLISIALSVLENIEPSEWKELLLKDRRVWSWEEQIYIGENSVMDVDSLFDLENIPIEKLSKVAERFRIFGLDFSPKWWSYENYEKKRQRSYFPRPRR